MSSNAEKLYELISNDSKKKQSLFMTALTNPKKALDKICDIGNELNISVTKEEVIDYLSTIDDEATKMWLVKARGVFRRRFRIIIVLICHRFYSFFVPTSSS